MTNRRTKIYEPARDGRIAARREDYWVVSFQGEGSAESMKKFWKAISPETNFPYVTFRIAKEGFRIWQPLWLTVGILSDSGTKRFDEWAHVNYFGFYLDYGASHGSISEKVSALAPEEFQTEALASMVALSHKSPEQGWKTLLSSGDTKSRLYHLAVETDEMARVLRNHLENVFASNHSQIELSEVRHAKS